MRKRRGSAIKGKKRAMRLVAANACCLLVRWGMANQRHKDTICCKRGRQSNRPD